MGGIYAGLLTPSESAAVAGVWAALIGFIIYRELTFTGLVLYLKETAITTAVIFFDYSNCNIFKRGINLYTNSPKNN